MENMNYNTFVFMDLETTGLPVYEHNKTKITELCLVAVQSQHLSSGVLPRVQNKLSLCFNPRKLISDDSEEITGLTNTLLENLQWFSSKTVDSINLFFDHQPKPICLVAHNGKYFDFPILKAEIGKTGTQLLEDIYCVDSFNIFKQIYWSECDTTDNSSVHYEDTNDSTCVAYKDKNSSSSSTIERALKIQKLNETTPKKGKKDSESTHPERTKGENVRRALGFSPSFKLEDVYRRLTNREPKGLHRAEDDTIILLTCALTLGNKFINQSKLVGQKFSEISPMTPGIKIGTKR